MDASIVIAMTARGRQGLLENPSFSMFFIFSSKIAYDVLFESLFLNRWQLTQRRLFRQARRKNTTHLQERYFANLYGAGKQSLHRRALSRVPSDLIQRLIL